VLLWCSMDMVWHRPILSSVLFILLLLPHKEKKNQTGREARVGKREARPTSKLAPCTHEPCPALPCPPIFGISVKQDIWEFEVHRKYRGCIVYAMLQCNVIYPIQRISDIGKGEWAKRKPKKKKKKRP